MILKLIWKHRELIWIATILIGVFAYRHKAAEADRYKDNFNSQTKTYQGKTGPVTQTDPIILNRGEMKSKFKDEAKELKVRKGQILSNTHISGKSEKTFETKGRDTLLITIHDTVLAQVFDYSDSIYTVHGLRVGDQYSLTITSRIDLSATLIHYRKWFLGRKRTRLLVRSLLPGVEIGKYKYIERKR